MKSTSNFPGTSESRSEPDAPLRVGRLSTRRKLVYLVVANFLVFLVATLVVVALGRVFLALRPSYEVVFLEPDRQLGWKQVPGHEFTWAGAWWYAREFSVDVRVNSRGFRDHDRQVAKPDGMRRVALLGDSFVEALQVPLERTTGQLLEARLNEEDPPWEVLNFGVSNYGVGQYLLVWESQARDFAPDFVFVLVADFHLSRTLKRFEQGAFRATRNDQLWVRPTFRLRGEQLVREPARDFEEFRRVQNHLIESEFDGERVRIRERSLLGHYFKLWFANRDEGGARKPSDTSDSRTPVVPVNLRILAELGHKTRLVGSRLVIVDASRFFHPQSRLAGVLRRFSAREKVGYIALWEELNREKESGNAMQWKYDGHFSEAAHEVFASALHGWLTSRGLEPDSGSRPGR